jgi:hypothetical protein
MNERTFCSILIVKLLALVQSHPFTGRAKHLNKLIEPKLKRLPSGKGKLWSTTGIPIWRLPEGLSIKPSIRIGKI